MMSGKGVSVWQIGMNGVVKDRAEIGGDGLEIGWRCA
jgi:hypothetical protein